MSRTNNRYMISRIGFINFYGYINQTFNIDEGIAGFIGDNGSGKSVTTLAALPNLLTMDDINSMNISSNESRSIRNISNYFKYLKDDIPDVGHTSYIWIEFKKNNQYKNLVIGYRKNQKDTKKEGFVGKSTDYQIDPNKDFTDDNGAILSIREFKVKHHSHFNAYSSQTNYQEAVNNYLYGFKNQEKFNYMIKKIINNANTQKKDKNYANSLDECIDILNNALPDIEDHPQFIDSAENVIQIITNRRELERNKKEIKSNIDNLNEIESIISKINNTIYHRQIMKNHDELKFIFEDATKQKNQNDENINDFTNKINKKQSKLDSNTNKINNIKNRINEIDTTINNYENSDNMNKHKDLTDQLQYIDEQLNDLKKRKNIDSKELENIKTKINNIDSKIKNNELSIDELISNIDSLAYNDIFKNTPDFDSILKSYFNGFKELDTLRRNNKQHLSDRNNESIKMDNINDSIQDLNGQLSNEKNDMHQSLTSIVHKINNESERHDSIFPIDTIDVTLLSNDDNIYVQTINQIKNIYNTKSNDQKVKLNTKYQNLNQLKDDLNKEENSKNTLRQSKSHNDESYVNLYECIKFKPNVNQKIKDFIEAALYYDNGLFTIMESVNDLSEIKDGQINNSITNEKSSNMFDYIQLEDNMCQFEDHVITILNQYHYNISKDIIERNNISIIPEFQPESHIGATAREENRLRNIEQLNQKITKTQKDIDDLNASIDINKKHEKHWTLMINQIPNTKHYDYLNDQIQKENNNLAKVQSNINQLNIKLEEFESEQEHIIDEYFESRFNDIINPTDSDAKDQYDRVKMNFGMYQSFIRDLQSYKQNNINLEDAIEDYKIDIENKQDSIDLTNKSIESNTKQKDKLESDIKAIEKLLNNNDIDIPKLRSEKRALYQSIDELQENNAELNGDIKYNQQSKEACIDKIDTLTDKVNQSERNFNEISEIINNLPHMNLINKSFNEHEMFKSISSAKTAYNGGSEQYGLISKIQKGDLAITNYKIIINTMDDVSKYLENYIKFEFIHTLDQTKHSYEDIINDLSDQQNSIDYTELNIDNQISNVLQTKGLQDVINDTIQQAKENAEHIESIQEQSQMDDNISYYVKWTERNDKDKDKNKDRMKVNDARRFNNLFKKDKPTNKDDIIKIFELIESQINFNIKHNGLPEDFDLDIENYKKPLYNIIKDIFNYKKWHQFDLYERQKNQNEKQLLTNKSFSSNSNGQINRLKFEMMLSSIEFDKTNMTHNDAPIIMVLEEAFSMIDNTIHAYLMKRIHENNINFIFNAPSYGLPELNNYPLTVNSFALRSFNNNGIVMIDIEPIKHESINTK